MGIEGLDHLYVETRRFDRARAFWEALGFAVADEWGGAGHRACRLESGSAAVVLAETDPQGDPQRPTAHLRMSDADAIDAALATEDAVEVLTPLSDTHWGTRWVRVRDPDGNLHCLESPPDPT